MRLGLLADIHEAVEPLAAAVRELKARRVDAFVMLGDVLEAGERVDETVALLAALPGAGVWGNHDLGLCGEIEPALRGQFTAATIDYFSRLTAWVDLDGSRFQHIDPHLDPSSFEDLWRFTTDEERIAGFGRCSHTRVFAGHMHRWGLFTPERQVAWDGEETFRYEADERYLTLVHAVRDGWCGLVDSDRGELEPIRVT